MNLDFEKRGAAFWDEKKELPVAPAEYDFEKRGVAFWDEPPPEPQGIGRSITSSLIIPAVDLAKGALFGELPEGLGYLQKPIETAIDFYKEKGFLMTPEQEAEMAREHPNLMAARYAIASLLPGGEKIVSPEKREEFANLPPELQRVEILGETAGWALAPYALKYAGKGIGALLKKIPFFEKNWNKPLMQYLKESTWFRMATNKERGLTVLTVENMQAQGMKDAQILRNLNNPTWRKTAFKEQFDTMLGVRARGEAPKVTPVAPEAAKPVPPIELEYPGKKPTTKLGAEAQRQIWAERKPSKLAELGKREVAVAKAEPEYDFETKGKELTKVEPPKPVTPTIKAAPKVEGVKPTDKISLAEIKQSIYEGKRIPRYTLEEHQGDPLIDRILEMPKGYEHVAIRTIAANEKFSPLIGKKYKTPDGLEWQVEAFTDQGHPFFVKVVNGKVQKKQYTVAQFSREWAERELAKAKPPSPVGKGKEPWEMTVEEAIQYNKKRVIKSGVEEGEIDKAQIKMWEDAHIRAIADSPRNTDISAKVLESLPETARESLLRTHPIAASNWVDSLKIWNKPYREVLQDVQIRAGIGDVKKMHRQSVKQALSEGKAVPANVLAEYPELGKGIKDLSRTFEENPSRLADVTNKYLRENLDPKTEQRLDEGVGSYKNRLVFKLKDGNYYYFSELMKGKAGREKQRLIKLEDTKLIDPIAKFKATVKAADAMVKATEKLSSEPVGRVQNRDNVELFSGIPFTKIDKKVLKPLRDLYQKHVGDPLWNYIAEQAPVMAGKKSELIDRINKGLITDYRKDPAFIDLRDDTQLKISQYREKAKEIAQAIAKFPGPEQIRIAQIIKGSITTMPKRYGTAIEAMNEFQRLENELQDIGILSKDTFLRKFTRKELAGKFKEIKDLESKMEVLTKKLRPITKISPITRKVSEQVSEDITSRSETATEGLYEAKVTKWTELNEQRVKEALTARGFAEGEADQMVRRVKESVIPLEGKTGTIKEIREIVEKTVTRTITQEIEKLVTYSPSMMARARGSIIKEINKLDGKRNDILKRIQLHYKTAGQLYLRRAYEKIENEKKFFADLLKYIKKPRLKKTYTIQRKDLSYEQRKALGEIQKAPYLVYRGLSEETHDLELMRMFQEVAKNKDWSISAEHLAQIRSNPAMADLVPKYENFKPMPVSDKLGPLSSKLIDPYIWDDLNQAVVLRSDLIKAWDKALSLWKTGKVVYNPATQFRNLLSNSILADFGGLPQTRVDIYARAAHDLLTKSGYWKEAKQTPLLGTEWAEAETHKFLSDASKLKSANGGWLVQSANVARSLADKPGKAYQGIEQLFKLAIFIHQREQGASIKDAAKHAEKWIFNYQKIPPVIRWAKRWYSPFITFSYKALPRFAEATIRTPWRVAKYLLLLKTAEEIVRQYQGESKHQIELEKKVLPDYMQHSIFPGQLGHARVGLKDKFGRSRYLDLTFIMPWGDVGEQWGQSRLTFRPLLPNLPLWVTLSEIAHDSILFSDKDLTDKDIDETSDYMKKIGTQIWRQAVPSLAGSYSFNKLMAAYYGEKDWMGRDRSLTDAIFDTMLGIKFRAIDYNEVYGRRTGELRGKIDIVKKEFRREYWRLTTMDKQDPKAIEKLYKTTNEKIERLTEKITDLSQVKEK